MPRDLDALRRSVHEILPKAGPFKGRCEELPDAILRELHALREELDAFLSEQRDCVEAWRLQSVVHDFLGEAGDALLCMREVLNRHPASKPDHKRLAMLQGRLDREQEAASFPLTQDQIDDLRAHLQSRLPAAGCAHSFTLTLEWLREHFAPNPEVVLNHIRARALFCDCEVVLNLVEP